MASGLLRINSLLFNVDLGVVGVACGVGGASGGRPLHRLTQPHPSTPAPVDEGFVEEGGGAGVVLVAEGVGVLDCCAIFELLWGCCCCCCGGCSLLKVASCVEACC